MTFNASDLEQLDRLLLSRARAVISLREVHAGNHSPDTIALRHDVDDNTGSFENAQNLARWEAKRGYRSTYYVLHTARYWNNQPFFRAGLEEIALAGHEIGIHVNAIAHALWTGSDPVEVLHAAIDELRSWGHTITGAASHGEQPVCKEAGFTNYDLFTIAGRKSTTLTYRGRTLTLDPMPLEAFGLSYEAYHIHRTKYLTDTGGTWKPGLEDFALAHDFKGQVQVLQHPDWWGAALSPEKVAA